MKDTGNISLRSSEVLFIVHWPLETISLWKTYQIMYELHPRFSQSTSPIKGAFEFSTLSKVALD